MKTKAVIYGVAAAVAIAAAALLVKTCREDLAESRELERQRELERARRRHEIAKETPPPPTVAPSFTSRARADSSWSADLRDADQATAVLLEELAMKRVFERCAPKSSLFHEGVKVEGNLVFKNKFPWHRVNVFVTVPDPSKTEGHSLLPYMITFDGSNTPQTIQATKDVAATLCGLGASHTDFSL